MKTKEIIMAAALGIVNVSAFSCSCEKETTPTVTTDEVTSIDYTSAVCGGKVTSNGGVRVSVRGLVWDTLPNPTVNVSTKTVDTSGTIKFSDVVVSNLSADTKYYIRAYATNSEGTSYGKTVEFSTRRFECEGVDLGLSVIWATCNLGAENETEAGYYFAWGELDTYYNPYYQTTWRPGKEKGYNWDSYKYTSDGGKTFLKYCDADRKVELDSTDDAALKMSGNVWRMPTLNEWRELIDTARSTVWKWEAKSKGYRITSKIKGYEDKSIFIPASGSYDGILLNTDSVYGDYWASDKRDDKAQISYKFRFSANDRSLTSEYRYMGLSVRSVCKKK